MPLHAAPFWWWRAAWRGAGHVSPLLGAGSLVVKLTQLSWRELRCSARAYANPSRVLSSTSSRDTPPRGSWDLVVSMKILPC